MPLCWCYERAQVPAGLALRGGADQLGVTRDRDRFRVREIVALRVVGQISLDEVEGLELGLSSYLRPEAQPHQSLRA